MTTSTKSRDGGPHFHFHGYPAVHVDGRLVPLKLKRALALLVFLSAQQRPVGRESVAALLWPDSPVEVARARLRRLVHETHAAVGVPLIDGDGDALWLSRGWTSDLAATQAAVQAVSDTQPLSSSHLDLLTRPGAAAILNGFDIDSEAFEDWLAESRRTHASQLVSALARAAAIALKAGDLDTADRTSTALLLHDPHAEQGHIVRIESRALRGDIAGVESAYFDCANVMRSEFGLGPSGRIESVYATASAALGAKEVKIRYAPTSSGKVAYVTWGQGDSTLVFMWGGAINIELALEERRARRFLDSLASNHRLVLLDRRGTGLSERVGVVPNADNGLEDIEAVLDHMGASRVWLFGSLVAGTFAIEFALRRAQRLAGLILYATSPKGSWSEDWPWVKTPAEFAAWVALLTDPTRVLDSLSYCAPSVADDPTVRNWFVRVVRNSVSDVGREAIMRAYQNTDLRPHLGELRMPTLVMHRRGDRIISFQASKHMAGAIPNARFVLLEGDDNFLWCGDSEAALEAINRFIRTGDA